MNHRQFSRASRSGFAAAAIITTLIGVTACGASLEESQAGTGAEARAGAETLAADPELSEMVPASIRDKGTLTVATAVYAPAVMEPAGGGEVTGWDIELTRKAAALLGLEVDFEVVPFDGIIPGLQAGRYDAATGEINVTAERTEVVTFVTNYASKDEFIVKEDSEDTSFDEPGDVCGLKIAASLGSSQAATAQDIADQCASSGGAETTVDTFQTQAQVNLALSQGRIDAALASGSQVAYTVDQGNGQFKVATLGFGEEIPSGLALANTADTPQLAEAFQAATNKLIEDGQLVEVLDELNAGLGAVDTSEIMPEPSN